MSAKRKPPANRQILDQAAEFFVEFESGDADAATRERFDAWLQTSPEHVRAYLELMPIWEDGTLRRDGSDESPQAYIAKARAENVVPLEVERDEQPARRVPDRRVMAVAASIAVLATAFGMWSYAQRQTYSTGIGEQRSIALEDGSTVELNARSRLKVRFTEKSRTIELVEGQALFQVAGSASRPFIVENDGVQVRVLGTQFDVYRKRTGLVVTVVEGKVAVVSGGKTVPLSVGQQLTVAEDIWSPPINVDTTAVTAWTRRELIFDRTALAEVAEEFNRYNTRQLIVNDRSLADFHVTGVFSSTDLSPFIRFLRDQSGLTVDDSGRSIRITTR